MATAHQFNAWGVLNERRGRLGCAVPRRETKVDGRFSGRKAKMMTTASASTYNEGCSNPFLDDHLSANEV